MSAIFIQINDPDKLEDQLSDLTCWWQGFKMGLKLSDLYEWQVAENGIEAIRQIKNQIQDQKTKHDT